jgi:hypothetical protein
MEGDGVGSGVQPLVGQLLAELDDLLLELHRCLLRAAQGTPGARLQARLTVGLEPVDELMDPLPGDPVVPGHLRLCAPLELDRGDHQSSQRHRTPPRPEV